METKLTKQDILELFEKQSKSFEQLIIRERKETEKRHKEADERHREADERFEKKLGQLAGTWGKFVAEMVKPKIIDLFRFHPKNVLKTNIQIFFTITNINK